MDALWHVAGISLAAFALVVVVEVGYLSWKKHNRKRRRPYTLMVGRGHRIRVGEEISLDGQSRFVKSVTETTITLQ